jgi:hypothetical protein
MALQLVDLNAATRAAMLAELEEDLAARKVALSPHLREGAGADYVGLLVAAVKENHDAWLAAALRTKGFVRSHETRPTQHGPKRVTLPPNEPDLLAEAEFNRYYMRGLCRRAIEEGVPTLSICRAKAVDKPRPEADRLVGTPIDPCVLLEALQGGASPDEALGLPPGRESGLSVRIRR